MRPQREVVVLLASKPRQIEDDNEVNAPVGLELPILALNRELDNVARRPPSDLR
jgi:hypothetical protein